MGWKSWRSEEGSNGCFAAEEGSLLTCRRVLMCGLEVLEVGGGEQRLLRGRGGLTVGG